MSMANVVSDLRAINLMTITKNNNNNNNITRIILFQNSLVLVCSNNLTLYHTYPRHRLWYCLILLLVGTYNLYVSLNKYVCKWSDSIPTEAYKSWGIVHIEKLHTDEGTRYNYSRVQQRHHHPHVQTERQPATMRHNRGISLLSIADKILARVLLNRITTHIEQGLLPEGQCGFRKARCTIDMVFTTGLLQEEMQE